jgi:hypothetical protein
MELRELGVLDRKRIYYPSRKIKRDLFENELETLIRMPDLGDGLLHAKSFSGIINWDITIKESVWVDKNSGKLEIIEHNPFLWDFLMEMKKRPDEAWFVAFFSLYGPDPNGTLHVFSNKKIVVSDDYCMSARSFGGRYLCVESLPPYGEERLFLDIPGGRWYIGRDTDALLVEISEEEFKRLSILEKHQYSEIS